MAILHYKLTKNDENVRLNRFIHSQQFTFKRAIVVFTEPETAVAHPNEGLLVVQPSYLTGLEIVSGDNSNSNDIVIGLERGLDVIDRWYDWNFDSEDVPEAFYVRTFRGDGTPAVFSQDTAIPASGPGIIRSIDIFFEFQSLSGVGAFGV